jgi:hypothetical protein
MIKGLACAQEKGWWSGASNVSRPCDQRSVTRARQNASITYFRWSGHQNQVPPLRVTSLGARTSSGATKRDTLGTPRSRGEPSGEDSSTASRRSDERLDWSASQVNMNVCASIGQVVASSYLSRVLRQAVQEMQHQQEAMAEQAKERAKQERLKMSLRRGTLHQILERNRIAPKRVSSELRARLVPLLELTKDFLTMPRARSCKCRHCRRRERAYDRLIQTVA